MKHAVLIVVLLSTLPVKSMAQSSCKTYGHETFCSDGTSYKTYGNETFGSDGTHYKTYGQETFGSDGSHSKTIGNTTFSSDGTTYRTYGNETFGSDGSSYKKIGNTVFSSNGPPSPGLFKEKEDEKNKESLFPDSTFETTTEPEEDHQNYQRKQHQLPVVDNFDDWTD